MAWHCLRAGLLMSMVWSAIGAAEPPRQPTMRLNVPEGFAIEMVAGPPLVERPVTAAFDEEGRLYVAVSSGSNERVEKQLAERPHRILRLVDTDGDGIFDTSTVFADRMMFPSGTMFHDGSLYVSAPPTIWKLTDADGDGVAERREEWFQGQTLTSCANDLHGPYWGPDGRIYWCKGAGAEQTHTIRGREWKSRASHIYRCRPDGTDLEAVLTGGMDNPVDVVFTPEGERLLTSTFVVHPGNGQRDGLIHAIYGGVYGKDRETIDGHPRSGELMPIMTHLGPGAPCGFERYESHAFGDAYRDNLFVSQFNLHKVSRHVLQQAGSSFTTTDADFVKSEDLDFHPTDVLEDADGSLIVVDTGGWYKLCCPTSQLEKPDILGGIYRVRKIGIEPPIDPRGQQIAWHSLRLSELWALMADQRPAVRSRAIDRFASQRSTAALSGFLGRVTSTGELAERSADKSEKTALHRIPDRDVRRIAQVRVWALAPVDTDESRALVRNVLQNSDEHVRQVALHVVSLNRDARAIPKLIDVLRNDAAPLRRVAAEALGRMGNPQAVSHLLSAASADKDRVLQHSIVYALIEIADATATQAGLAAAAPGTVQAALLALDQMQGGGLRPTQVIPLLDSPAQNLQQTASWIVARHPDWGGDLAQWLREQLAAVPDEPESADPREETPLLEALLTKFAVHPTVQHLLVTSATQQNLPAAAQRLTLRAMAHAQLDKPSSAWSDALAQVIVEADPTLLALAVAAAAALPTQETPPASLTAALATAVDCETLPALVRVRALTALMSHPVDISASRFDLLIGALSLDNPVALRSLAADALSKASLSPAQLERLCDVIKHVSPLELHRLLEPFGQTADPQLGFKLLSSLKQSSALSSLQVSVVQARLANYGPEVQQGIEELYALVNVDIDSQRRKVAELLPHMADGDVRRGQAVFASAKATCTACHRMGYTGGQTGPDLSRIGETRSERDLLEAILYPSLSFVRSFEPMAVTTVDGKILNGLVRSETSQEVVLTTGPNQEVRIPRDEIEELRPGTISIMPAGLDQQLTVQELADLVAFLKHAK